MVITLELWPARGRNRTGARTVLASELTDGQWNLIKDLFVERPTGGRPRVPPRPCLEGILWVLRSGARWKDLPHQFHSYCTCWRRLNEWMNAGLFEEAWRRVLHKLDAKGRIDWRVAMAEVGAGWSSRALLGAGMFEATHTYDRKNRRTHRH